MSDRYRELFLAAQTAYAELAERTRAYEMANALAGLNGTFNIAARKNRQYWYFTYREPGGDRPRLVYVGPDNDDVRTLVERFRNSRADAPLVPQARAAIAHGCAPLATKHFRIIKRLSEYGLFRAGGILVGTHAFVALANVLGVRWMEGETTLDVDVAHAGRNISVALPADLRIDAHGALQSLQMGLLPITELDGSLGAQYRSPDGEVRVDFLTTKTRSGKPVVMPNLNVALEPLKFMELSLEGTTQGCVFAGSGACTVNLPSPERYAIHKMIVYGERPVRERTKANKDLLQSAALVSWFLNNDRSAEINEAWRDTNGRGAGWRSRAARGLKALLRLAPELDAAALWSA